MKRSTVGLPPLSPSSTVSLSSSSSSYSMPKAVANGNGDGNVHSNGVVVDGGSSRSSSSSRSSRRKNGSKREAGRKKRRDSVGGKRKTKSKSPSRRGRSKNKEKETKGKDKDARRDRSRSRGRGRGRSRSQSLSRHSHELSLNQSRSPSRSRSRRHSSHKRRHVRFNMRVRYRTIRHIQDFRQKEIDCSWYCKSDYERMLEDVRHISDLMNESADIVSQSQDFSVNGREICSRGLEHLIDEDVADYRSDIMTQALDAVLDEQEIQRTENLYDPDLMASIYTEIGMALQREAYLVALRDALEVLHIEGLGETSAAREYEQMSSVIHDEVYQATEPVDSVVHTFHLPGPEDPAFATRPDFPESQSNPSRDYYEGNYQRPRVDTNMSSPNDSRWRKDSPSSKNARQMPTKPRKSRSPSSAPPISPDSVTDVVGVQSTRETR